MDKSKKCKRCGKEFPHNGIDLCDQCMPMHFLDYEKMGQILQEIYDIVKDPKNILSVDQAIVLVSENNGINEKERQIKREFIKYVKSENVVECHVCKESVNKMSTNKFKNSGIRVCYRCFMLIDSENFSEFKLMTREEVMKREIDFAMGMLAKNKIGRSCIEE